MAKARKAAARRVRKTQAAAVAAAPEPVAAAAPPPEDRRTNLPVQRWTEGLLVAGFVPVARVFLRNYARLEPPLTPAEAMFVVHLIDFKRDKNPPFPSYKRLAGYLGVSDKMVRVYARRLQEKGYLRRVVRVAKPNLFDLTPLFTALERRITKARAAGRDGENGAA